MNLKLSSLFRMSGAFFTVFLIATSSMNTVTRAQNTVNFSSGGSAKALRAVSVVTTEQVRAELIAHAPQGVQTGQPVWVGLKIAHKPEWHTYWKNSGDSGLPTTLEWKLPVGVSAGDIAWPAPKKIPIGNLANYGYENTVVLPVALTLPTGFSGDKLVVELQANWLVCKQECIPEEGTFTLSIPTRGSYAANAADFEAAFAAAPKPSTAQASFKPQAGGILAININGLPANWAGQALNFYPEIGSLIQTAAVPTQKWSGDAFSISVPLDPQRSASPDGLAMVLSSQAKGAEPSAIRVVAKLDGAWPAGASVAAVPTALDTALKANLIEKSAPVAPSMTFWLALVSAFIGGLILNLMPCVFPVLALKVFAVVQPGTSPALRRKSATAYTVGVVASMVALAALMLALRSAGEAVGWGFQLQTPAVVATLAALFTILTLNFAGVFEFGSFLPSRVATLQAKSPVVDSALSGVLAVAVASPCTAPFMGASLGFAAGLPAVQALAIFASLGLGLALPFLLIGWVPAVAKFLPRPGAWMDTARKVMAFPMAATVVWLVWVLGQQTGIDGAGALLMILVALSFVAWSLGQTRRIKLIFTIISIATVSMITVTIGQKVVEMLPVETPNATAAPSSKEWGAWQPGKVDQLLASGQPVFVDFTAAWCVTCQFNKKNALADNALIADMASKNVARLRADWTRRDPAITQALTELGRNGVPVYVLYRKGAAPQVFSEILSASELRAAIAKI